MFFVYFTMNSIINLRIEYNLGMLSLNAQLKNSENYTFEKVILHIICNYNINSPYLREQCSIKNFAIYFIKNSVTRV